MPRVGVVDLGTNTTRLLVADVEDGLVRELERREAITRLGEGVDARRELLPTAIARVRNVLTDYRRAIESYRAERTLAFATSAVRDAENGEAFLGEIEWSYGFATRLLSGEEEALLAFRGVATGREVSEGTLIIDIGGGSTELVLGEPDGVSFHESLPLGSVRLTERFVASDPPLEEELEACAAAIRSFLGERVPDGTRAEVRTAIGLAGTITTLAALDLGLEEYDRDRVHGYSLTAAAVENQLARLASVPLAERRGLRPLHPDRAPVIVAGTVLVRELLAYFDLAELEVSERDILDGAALEAAALPEPVEGDAPPGAFTCC